MKNKIFFITGSSGVGKSTLVKNLRAILPAEYKIHDFDEKGVPENADIVWRKKTTADWLRVTKENIEAGFSTIIIGLTQPDEVMEANHTHSLDVQFILLDASDEEIKKRLYSYRFSTPEKVESLFKTTGQTPERFIEGDNKNHTNLIRKLAKEYNAIVVDTTNLDPETVALEVKNIITK